MTTYWDLSDEQGPTSTLYSNRTRILLSYSNPTRNFLNFHPSNSLNSHKLSTKFVLDVKNCHSQGPTSTLYSNRTRIFLSYSNPTRKFLKNDRVASSVYFSHFREFAARPATQYYSHMNTALVRSPMSFDHKKSKCIFGSKRNTQ